MRYKFMLIIFLAAVAAAFCAGCASTQDQPVSGERAEYRKVLSRTVVYD